MPRNTFILNATIIKAGMAKLRLTQEKFAHKCGIHPTRLSGYLNGEPASLKTLLNIAEALDYDTDKGEHMLLTLNDDGNPSTSVSQEPNALPHAPPGQEPVVVVRLPNQIIIIINADAALTKAQADQVISFVVSPNAKAPVKHIGRGSIVLNVEADEAGTKDLVDSFLAWRIQHIGVFELLVISPRECSDDIVQACSSHFRFAAPAIEETFKARLLAGRETRLATGSGLHIVKRNPLNRISAGSDEVGDALGAAIAARAFTEDAWDTVNTAGKGSDAAWRAASNAWNKAYKQLGMAAESVLEVFSGSFRAAANAAIEAADAASDVTATQWDIRASAANAAKKAAYDALRAIEEAENNMSSHAGYHFWGFSSTLSPWQIGDAQHYWTTSKLDNIPQRARFPENELIEPQSAILLDDEAFQDRLYYQPLR